MLSVSIMDALHAKDLKPSCSVQDVADLFILSARSLERRLYEEGTTLSKLVSSYRVGYAKRLLSQTGYPLDHVAVLLGFASRRSLNVFLINHIGMTGKAYRDRVRGAG